MDVIISLAITVLREGFIYGIMAMGVFITYKMLNFPDLSVDGTFPLGACVTAALITAGVNPWIACIFAFLAGAAAGSITGILHVKLGITDLLSGILVMTAMWSINLLVTGGTAILQFFNKPTIFTSGIIKIIPNSLADYKKLIMVFILAVIVKLLIDWFLKTKTGLLLRATGNNDCYVTYLGKNAGNMKIMGLAIGNGFTALAGSVLSQFSESADINSGKGMVVMALAAVIMGTSLFKRVSFMKATTMALLGAIIYKACLQIALQLGLPNNLLKLLMSLLLTIAIVSNRFVRKGGNLNVAK